MKQFEIKAHGLEELSPRESKILGGNVCGTLGPQGSDPSILADAVVDALKDACDWVRGFCKGLFS